MICWQTGRVGSKTRPTLISEIFMRIAVIGTRGIPASFGGVERHVEELYSRLADKGCEVTIYCRASYIEPVRNKVEWVKPMRVGRYRNCRLIVSKTPSIKGLEAFVHSFWATLLALRQPFDLYHYHALGPTLFAFLPILFGKQVVATCHGLDWQRGKWGGGARRFLQFCEKFMGRRVRNLICVSQDLQKHFSETYHRTAEYIPNGAAIPAAPVPADFREYDLESGKYIVFFGRLTHEKEIHTLIDAFAKVQTDCKLAIVGGSAHTDSYVESLRQRAGKNVVFTGFAYGEALNQLVGNSRFVVNPSRMEGLPIAVLEAYALGKHVLASDIPPHREVVRDESHLFRTSDADHLARQLEQLLKSDLPFRDQRLIDFVAEQYDWDRIAEQTHAYFCRLRT